MNESTRAKIDARKEVLSGIKDELVERLQLDVDPRDLDDDTFLFGSGLALDSIDAMEIIIGMQARFDVEIPEGDLSSMRTFNTLADLILAQQAGRSAPQLH
jgi:acyl carrier protein